MSLATVIGVAAVLWPMTLSAALAARAGGGDGPMVAAVYVSASRVCHQRAERSFHLAGTPWPVCTRCAGLYLAAPLGVAATALGRVRRRARLASLTAVAALPTAATWIAEALAGLPVDPWTRFAAAMPLGAVLAFVLVELARPTAGID